MSLKFRKTVIFLAMTLLVAAVLFTYVHADETYTVRMDGENPKITMTKGSALKLQVTSGGKNIAASDVKFSFSKKRVAQVTAEGVLNAVKKGKTVLTVIYNDQSVKVNVAVKKNAGSSSETAADSQKSSGGTCKMTSSSGSRITTGNIVTLTLNKAAIGREWTWSFTGTASGSARILNGQYKKNGKITFTVWPSGGTLDVVGTDPTGTTMRCSFTVKQNKTWKRREGVRNTVLAGLTPGMTTAQKLKYFVEWIADHTEYGHGNYFGVLDGKPGDCISYSAGFKFFCDAIGVETIIVKNAGAKSHYWNQVNLDGVWYNVDAQGYDTSRSKKWFLSSNERHGYNGDTTYQAQVGIWYPFSPAHVCTSNYKE